MADRPILVIANKNYSSWSMRPWLLLVQNDVDFEERRLPLGTPEFANEIERWSPTARVPAFVHGDVRAWDSLAICEYANEALLGDRAWPDGRAARAYARSIVAEMHSGFADLRRECPMNVRRQFESPRRLTDGARADVARIREIFRDARARYGGDGGLLFDRFTIADAFFAPVLFRFRTYRIEIGDVEQRYSDAVMALPGVRRWIAEAAAETESMPKYDTLAP